ncbi:PP0621 family protein [Oceanospirillum beijerinckii]|uniref:PP0621 family protein n=1 Tax=Oceanospirillum beijerinckii TaxID=64976 RepID=UPI00040DB7AF|nr:PP0621 family protein [Oceanospirillum beijerinckii]
MGFIIFRLIIFAALVWVGIRLLKAYNRKKLEYQQKHVKDKKEQSEQMVQCRFCSLHLPQKDAVKHEQLWFCCHEHKQHFLDDGPEQR